MLIFSAFAFFAVFSTASAGQLSFMGGGYKVEWKHLPATQEIQFNITLNITAGWYGLGISKENSGMKELDVYVGESASKEIVVSLL